MSLKVLKIFTTSLFIQGCVAFFFLLQYEILQNYRLLKIVLPVSHIIAFIILLVVWIFLSRKKMMAQRMTQELNEFINKTQQNLFTIQSIIVISAILAFEFFVLTFFSFPPPMRPLFIWVLLACIQAWITLRFVYSERYRARPSLKVRLKNIWLGWSKTQKRVFITLLVLGVINFVIFFPINNGGRIHGDEEVIYPDLVKLLTIEDTFYDTLFDFLIVDNWWYGYPYFPISASVLLIPRIIFGNTYGENIQLNLLLLRQFITVLPMIVATIILIFTINDFKSYWGSVGMYAVMALVPGIVRNHTRFWHPDSLIVLFVVLTFFFLKKDRLNYGKYFYLAAFSVGMAAAIKLWGLFFFLAIGGYVIAGFIEKKVGFWKMVRNGILFILVLAITIIISTPSLLIPWVREAGVKSIEDFYPALREGYDEPDPHGVYEKGLAAWMVFFRIHYMHDIFFYFCLFAAVIGSIIGSQKYLNRLILGWSLIVGGYLILFVAKKSFQYMLPLMVPFYGVAFLFSGLADGSHYPEVLQFLSGKRTKGILTIIMIIILLGQTVYNINQIPISQTY